MTDIQLYTKLSGLPSNLKSELADFIDFLSTNQKNMIIEIQKDYQVKLKD